MDNYWEIWLIYLFEHFKPDVMIERYQTLYDIIIERTKETVSKRILGVLALILFFTIGLALIIGLVLLGLIIIPVTYLLWWVFWFILLALFVGFIWLIYIIGAKDGINEVSNWITEDTIFTYNELKNYIKDALQIC